MKQLVEEDDLGLVLITHDLAVVADMADEIAIMKDGAIEQCDTPDQIVLDPQTEYVRKFTEDIDKAHVVHASVLAKPVNGHAVEGEAVAGHLTIHQIARQLVSDPREHFPVAGKDGQVMGLMARQEALEVLLGDSEHG